MRYLHIKTNDLRLRQCEHLQQPSHSIEPGAKCTAGFFSSPRSRPDMSSWSIKIVECQSLLPGREICEAHGGAKGVVCQEMRSQGQAPWYPIRASTRMGEATTTLNHRRTVLTLSVLPQVQRSKYWLQALGTAAHHLRSWCGLCSSTGRTMIPSSIF